MADVRLIDANALENDFRRLRMLYGEDTNALTESEVASLDAISLIDKAPTLEYAPVRHGEWVGLEFDGYADGCPVYDLWECSECKGEHKGEYDTLTDYCPNCGALMDGGKKDGKRNQNDL